MPTSSESALLADLRSSPYYTVRIRPNVTADLSLDEMRKAVRENSVSLRGWDFPHYDERTVHLAEDYIFNVTNWSGHLELWRLYRSGQFVYFGTPWDVAMDFQPQLRKEFDSFVFSAHASQKQTVRGVLSFVGIIYSVTEFHLFSARLSRHLNFSSGALEVGLRNVEMWALASGQPGVLWHGFYQAHTNDIRLSSDIENVLADPVVSAASMLKRLFEYFDWTATDVTIKNWQDRLMAGKFAF